MVVVNQDAVKSTAKIFDFLKRKRDMGQVSGYPTLCCFIPRLLLSHVKPLAVKVPERSEQETVRLLVGFLVSSVALPVTQAV